MKCRMGLGELGEVTGNSLENGLLFYKKDNLMQSVLNYFKDQFNLLFSNIFAKKNLQTKFNYIILWKLFQYEPKIILAQEPTNCLSDTSSFKFNGIL